MNEYVQELLRLVPPPDKVLAASGDWNAAKYELGTSLPDDYKAIVSHDASGERIVFKWL